MAGINNNINGNILYGQSSYQTESQVQERIAHLRKILEDDVYNYHKELQRKKEQDELDFLEKMYKKNIALADRKLKAELAYNEKLEKLKAKKASEKEKKRLKKEYDAELANYDKIAKAIEKREKAREARKARDEAKEEAKKLREDRRDVGQTAFDGKKTVGERLEAIRNLRDEQGDEAVADAIISGLADLSKKLSNKIDEISLYQSKWNTRLQNSGKQFEGFSGIASKIAGVAAISPLVSQGKVMDNIDKLIDKGIAFNIEQRGFLETIKDKIATTFDAANGTLLQLIRVQQADTTAARLGMEASLTSFLNRTYQTTEYLSDVANSVKSAIYEATSQMNAQQGLAFEYQVQKWLGSLYSVGMSQTAVQNLATALGYLGSGNINSLQNSGMQNLLVMASSKMQQGYGGLLMSGLNESTTNDLLANIVGYLAEIANSGNNVVKAQLASIFGIGMSDLVAVTNLAADIATVKKGKLDYGGAMSELYSQANKMYSRTSVGEMMNTVWENFQYGMSSNIANNPATLALWKVANLLDDTVGGIAIPAISVLGNMVDLETTVADIMRVGALSGGILAGMGTMLGNLGSLGGFNPGGMLSSLGINRNSVTVLTRGTGLAASASGAEVSQSAYIGNASGSDVYESTMSGVSDTKNQTMAEAKEEESGVTIDTIDSHILDIYNLLSSVISMDALKVRIEGMDQNPLWGEGTIG